MTAAMVVWGLRTVGPRASLRHLVCCSRAAIIWQKISGPGMSGPSYPNGAAAYQHAGIIPRLGAHTPFANSIARASRRIQGRVVCRDRAGGRF